MGEMTRIHQSIGAPRGTRRVRAASAWLLALSFGLLAACDSGSSGTRRCTLSSECDDGQVCTGGRCVEGSANSCRTVDDCDPGQTCENNVCVEPTSDAGVDADAGADVTPDILIDLAPDLDAQEEEVFTTAPVVTSTNPADGATGVALDATVSVVFDQPMVAETFTPTNIHIEDYSGTTIERRISYNPPTRTVTLDPTNAAANFLPASPYTLIITTNLRAENNLTLAQQVEVTFYTVPFPNQDAYRNLARAYAPVVYAEVRKPTNDRDLTPRIDWFTSVNFDGDLDASNNLAHLQERSRNIPATVYYDVLETETHYLIQYVFYYPGGVVDPNNRITDAVEHDWAYSLVVVQKIDSDPLGRFVLAEGLGDAEVFAFGLSSYPDPCGGEGQDVCGGATPQLGDIWVSLDPAVLEPSVTDGPGRRYPTWMGPATHPSCAEPAYDTNAFRVENRCAHTIDGDTAPFTADDEPYSRILRLADGDTGDNWSATATADGNPGEMTYALVPFLDVLWTQRANAVLWDTSRNYTPPADGAGSGTYKVPSSLTTHDATASDPSRRAPFQAEADLGRTCGGCSRIGVWFIDPVWELKGALDFDHTFSSTYCFNPFLGIDTRGQGSCQ
jgi:hypothetical protein